MLLKPPRLFKPTAKIEEDIRRLRTRPAGFFERVGERQALELFRWTKRTTPAYRHFLNHHKVNGRVIKTIDDFKRLPIMTKENYLRRYRYLDLFPNRETASASTVSATSGSSGEPFYFPRNGIHDAGYQYEAEIFLREQWGIDKKKTLAILGFGLGIWIGGVFTYKVLDRITERGYDFTIIPTGTNREQFILAIKKFGRFYDQIILMGYPPFIKDVLDEGPDYGINWREYDLKILTAAEGYSEKFREYLAKKGHLKNMLADTINIYGTVELGTMAHETAPANLIRHLASKDKKLFRTLFPRATNIPTLCQYYPHLHYFEEVDGQVVVTGYGSSIPLVRYRFNDMGGVISFNEMLEKLNACGINLSQELTRHGLDKRVLRLPFVYVWGRSDFAVTLYGILIYPEYIKSIILDAIFADNITGRFCLVVRYTSAQNQRLEVNIELKKGTRIKNGLEDLLRKRMIEALLEHSTEYNHLFYGPGSYKKKLVPTINFWSYCHPKYFSRIGKQAWIGK